jgi:hypothetical protein
MATQDEDFQKRLNEALGMFGQAPADIPVQAVDPVRAERLAFEASQGAPVASVAPPASVAPVVPQQPALGSREALIAQQEQLRQNAIAQQEAYQKSTDAITQRPRQRFLNEGQSFMESLKNPGAGQRQFYINAGLDLLTSGATQDLSQRIGHALGAGAQGMQAARQGELDVASQAAKAKQAALGLQATNLNTELGFTKDLMALDRQEKSDQAAIAKSQADAAEKKTALEVAAQKTAFSQMSDAGKAQQQIQNAIENKDYSLAAQIQADYEKSTGVTGNKVTQAYNSIKDIRAENAQLTKLGTPEALAQIELNNSQIADQRRLAAGSGGQVIEMRDPDTGVVTFSMGSGNAKTALNQRKLEVGLMDKQWMSDLIGSVDAEQDIVDTIGDVIFSPNYKDVSGNIEGTVLETPFLGPLYNQILQTAPSRLLYRKANELSTRLALPQTRFFKPLSNTEWPIVRDAFKIPLSLDQDQVQDLFVTTRIPLILATTASAYNRRNPEMGTTAGTAAALEFASETMVSYIQKGLPLQAQDMETFGEEGYLNNNADYALKTWFPPADPALKNQGYILGQNNKLYTKDVVNAYVEAYKERSGARDYNAEQFMKDNGMEMY